jgi:short-subunit dehydrogenase
MRRIDLANRPIAITGASSGIGLATAFACAKAGMPVALAARREERLREAATLINAGGGKAIVVRADVSKPDDCRTLIERTVIEFGSIYSVFANAGYAQDTPVASTPDSVIRDMFETNFYGTLNTIRPALQFMMEAGQGHILICSSCLSKLGLPYGAAYSATKAAQDHFGRSLRIELRSSKVHVSTVHPIGTKTELFDTAAKLSPGAPSKIDRSPRAFMQPPERVASAVVRCLRKPRGEVWTSLPARLAFAAAIAAPGITDRVLASRLGRLPR